MSDGDKVKESQRVQKALADLQAIEEEAVEGAGKVVRTLILRDFGAIRASALGNDKMQATIGISLTFTFGADGRCIEGTSEVELKKTSRAKYTIKGNG